MRLIGVLILVLAREIIDRMRVSMVILGLWIEMLRGISESGFNAMAVMIRVGRESVKVIGWKCGGT